MACTAGGAGGRQGGSVTSLTPPDPSAIWVCLTQSQDSGPAWQPGDMPATKHVTICAGDRAQGAESGSKQASWQGHCCPFSRSTVTSQIADFETPVQGLTPESLLASLPLPVLAVHAASEVLEGHRYSCCLRGYQQSNRAGSTIHLQHRLLICECITQHAL